MDAVSINGRPLFIDEEKPVTSPRDVTGDIAVTGHIHSDLPGVTVAGDIFDADTMVGMQRESHAADGGVDLIGSWCDATHVCECRPQAYCTMDAHVERADIVKKNHPAQAVGKGSGEQQGSHHGIVTPWFVYHRTAEMIVLLAENRRLIRDAAATQVR
jgi:hypothetical protein